jgi:hypothetical protein
MPFVVGNLEYSVCPWTGDLLVAERELKNQTTTNFPEKVKIALALCDNPYRLKKHADKFDASLNQLNRAKFARNILTIFCRFNFLLARKYSDLKSIYFFDSASAINFFYSITSSSQINKLCLPRALFAAKTSAAFDTDGVIFIGAFLPSRSMHAWVIEKGAQPDAQDEIWHQYRPIAAIY